MGAAQEGVYAGDREPQWRRRAAGNARVPRGASGWKLEWVKGDAASSGFERRGAASQRRQRWGGIEFTNRESEREDRERDLPNPKLGFKGGQTRGCWARSSQQHSSAVPSCGRMSERLQEVRGALQKGLVVAKLSRPGTDANLARPEHVKQTPDGQSFPYPPKAHHMYIFIIREKH
uniref:Uncharacterized protein n=1 Tax=Ananas comosus var. bracteatus TaxID=296719 RepID=A0A6V7PYD8_ANACO|nr:unnamed protein product [Ananas comosus var. bracteatus]